jgi:hypothetical protein
MNIKTGNNKKPIKQNGKRIIAVAIRIQARGEM